MMLPSRSRLVVSGLAIAVLGACDRPTAPEARDQIEKAQRSVLEGRLSLGDMNLERLFYNSVGPSMWFPADSLTVERDGETTHYLAHVMERVYLPPPGAGGRPYVKRTLLAWDKENHRGLAFAADDSVGDIVSPTPALTADATPERIWHRPAFAVQSERDAHEAWFGTEGRIDFGVATKVGPCSLTQGNVGARFPVLENGTRLATICEDVRFTVSGTTLLEKRRTPGRAGIFNRWTSSKMPVRFDGQSVRGTRITTQCPENHDPRMDPPWACYTYLVFWRDQAQFAAGLGLDVTRIEQWPLQRNVSPVAYAQLVTAGSGEGLVSCCGPYGGPARYALYTPDGETLRESQAVVASADPFLKLLSFVDMSLFRDGSRMLFLIPADRFDRSMSRATPLILDLTILPCPADMRRGNSIGGSSAVGGPPSWGRCYPTP